MSAIRRHTVAAHGEYACRDHGYARVALDPGVFQPNHGPRQPRLRRYYTLGAFVDEEHGMRVCVIGTGYVGLTTGLCLSYIGHEVCCVDVDRDKVESLRGGVPTIHEPGIPEMLAEASGRIRFKDDLSEGMRGAQVVFVAVGTPPLSD